MSKGYGPVAILLVLSGTLKVNCDGIHQTYVPPTPEPPPPTPPTPPIPPIPPIPGFFKNFDISGGFGYPFPGIGAYPGGIGGPVPEGGPGIASPFGIPGLVPGASYIPQTPFGSALSAKGDIIFPVVLFVFFVVGVWTVIQFLLALIVPFIAGKFGIATPILSHPLHGRSAPDEDKQVANLNRIMNAVAKSMKKFDSVDCNNNLACSLGNSAHSKNGTALNDMLQELDELHESDPKMFEIFHNAAATGDKDCNREYPCSAASNSSHEHTDAISKIFKSRFGL